MTTKKPKGKNPPKKKRNPNRVQASTTGKGVNVRADQANWRTKLVESKIKFDDDQKEVFLGAIATHGLKIRSAQAAGVTMRTVYNHVENDPDFEEAYEEALQTYRDRFVDHATTLAYDGIEVRKYNKDGDLIEERKDYPIRLIELELKRVEPGYREKQTVDLNMKGGVMIAPADMTPEDWIKKQEAENEERDRLHEERSKANEPPPKKKG